MNTQEHTHTHINYWTDKARLNGDTEETLEQQTSFHRVLLSTKNKTEKQSDFLADFLAKLSLTDAFKGSVPPQITITPIETLINSWSLWLSNTVEVRIVSFVERKWLTEGKRNGYWCTELTVTRLKIETYSFFYQRVVLWQQGHFCS